MTSFGMAPRARCSRKVWYGRCCCCCMHAFCLNQLYDGSKTITSASILSASALLAHCRDFIAHAQHGAHHTYLIILLCPHAPSMCGFVGDCLTRSYAKILNIFRSTQSPRRQQRRRRGCRMEIIVFQKNFLFFLLLSSLFVACRSWRSIQNEWGKIGKDTLTFTSVYPHNGFKVVAWKLQCF